ncbi:MAG: phosphoserine phosphatase SerB [Rickettsiales bacterium]|nr:phosphoserine phosphatase SerB [Rickettsiales bacterium]
MTDVITILADLDKAPLDNAFIEGLLPSLTLHDITVEKIQWRKQAVACDLFTSHALAATIRTILADQPYDAIVQEVATRRKKLLISDMDSTMITVECIDELADFVGKKAEVSEVTERAMNGELNFEQALIARVALLKGLPQEALQECYDARVKMMAGAKALLAAHNKAGGHSILVSGGFTFFTSRVREALGFHEDYSNQLIIKDGALTGEVAMPILGKEAKLATLHASCEKLGITADDVLAIGDGANDLPMLLAAGLGVAYHAKPTVRAQAQHQLNHCDLSALIYTQGLNDQ